MAEIVDPGGAEQNRSTAPIGELSVAEPRIRHGCVEPQLVAEPGTAQSRPEPHRPVAQRRAASSGAGTEGRPIRGHEEDPTRM